MDAMHVSFAACPVRHSAMCVSLSITHTNAGKFKQQQKKREGNLYFSILLLLSHCNNKLYESMQ